MSSPIAQFTNNPLFGIAITVVIYTLAATLHAKLRTQLLNPLVVTAVAVMLILTTLQIPVTHYRLGGDMITFWLGPATVALAVPLHRQVQAWWRYMPALTLATLLGTVAGLSGAPLVALAWHTNRNLVLALVPRSVTTPIAIELARTLGAVPEITAAFVIVTGVLGHICGPRLLTLAGVHHPVARGLAVGVAAHGIGTARMLTESEQAGAASGMGMSLAGLLTALIIGGYATCFLVR